MVGEGDDFGGVGRNPGVRLRISALAIMDFQHFAIAGLNNDAASCLKCCGVKRSFASVMTRQPAPELENQRRKVE